MERLQSLKRVDQFNMNCAFTELSTHLRHRTFNENISSVVQSSISFVLSLSTVWDARYRCVGLCITFIMELMSLGRYLSPVFVHLGFFHGDIFMTSDRIEDQRS